MGNTSDNAIKLLNLTSRGLILNGMPEICKGLINESLRINNVTVSTVLELVRDNKSLWSFIGPQDYGKIKTLLIKIGGDTRWITADWLINSVKKQHPGIASLFLGDPTCHKWLEAQVNEIQVNLDALRTAPVK